MALHALQDIVRLLFLGCALPDSGLDRDMGRQGCDQLAARVAEGLGLAFGRWGGVHVSEDGECGAPVEAVPATASGRSRSYPLRMPARA